MKNRLVILIIGGLMPFINVFVSGDTLSFLNAELENKAQVYADKYKIEKALVLAVVEQESRRYKFAYRNDKTALSNQAWVTNAIKNNPSILAKYGDKLYHSAGYMQMLILVAVVEYGYSGTVEEFMGADVNLDYGCRHLKKLLIRYGNIKDVLSAYNQGWNGWRDIDKDGVHDPEEPYHNQSYVTDAYGYYQKLGGKY